MSDRTHEVEALDAIIDRQSIEIEQLLAHIEELRNGPCCTGCPDCMGVGWAVQYRSMNDEIKQLKARLHRISKPPDETELCKQPDPYGHHICGKPVGHEPPHGAMDWGLFR